MTSSHLEGWSSWRRVRRQHRMQFEMLTLGVPRVAWSLGVSRNCVHAAGWSPHVNAFWGGGCVSVGCDITVLCIEATGASGPLLPWSLTVTGWAA
jgi:hypothetical protein